MTAQSRLPLESVACPLCGRDGADNEPAASGKDYEYGTSDLAFCFKSCPPCDLIYLNPRPRRDALERIYPPHYYSFTGDEEGRGLVGWLRVQWEQRKVGDYTRWLGPGPRNVLDVGCGRGRLLSLMKQTHPDWGLYGIDLDPAAVAAAQAEGIRASHSIVEEYAPPVDFDLIILQQVIEHVAGPGQILKTLAQWLKPGGVLILETPNLAGWDYRLFRYGLWGGYHFPRHWTLFTRHSLKHLAETAGLQTVEQRSLMSLSFWSWSIHNALLTRAGAARLARRLRPPNAFLLGLTLPLELLQLVSGRQTSNQRLVARK